ncbi:MAG: hypothetical protein ACE3JN_07465 [Ectobacillus sp.]
MLTGNEKAAAPAGQMRPWTECSEESSSAPPAESVRLQRKINNQV